MTLEKIPAGSAVFLDSTIFVYHFTGASRQCRSLLERCERGEVRGMTSAVVVAEVAHRMMMIEALARRLVEGKGIPAKLRARPATVRKLVTYQEQVAAIPLMGIQVQPVDLALLLAAADLRKAEGLLVNDSLVAAGAIAAGAGVLASADRDFRRLDAPEIAWPTDLA
ncbi:MAG: type II toxin-antitoxin system VapC family toxin [Thermoanaerobaculia bacterium]